MRINSELLQEAARYTKATSKTALIEEALLVFVRVKAEERKRQGYAEKLRALEVRLSKQAPMRQGAREILRSDRTRDE
jgi:Bacterial antitoxin of type II TA system, VapB